MRIGLYIVVTLGLMTTLQACLPVVATGVGTGVLMAEDRRSAGTFVDDGTIEIKAMNRLRDEIRDQAAVSVTSFNRVVLLTGQAPTEALKKKAEEVVRGVPEIRNVFNELTIAEPRAYASRSGDGYLTSKVKARMIDARKFQANRVKVVSEENVVYLMGLVTRQEAEDATLITSTTDGVQRVVRLFEYIDG